MKLTTRIPPDEVRAHATGITAYIRCQSGLSEEVREKLCVYALEELERIMNHAFSEGRLFERRNPVTP